ncbi:MAG: bifunctional glutamate N-acetyltransferase/amino-acid acetyltransferase ArgJ [Planctomycetes bacterium]|nr:bifunctional glutamate N-acetyltransferase/amino-acid acetyltransferase ArgJ [Planctomycetota bacterium]
MLKKIKLQEIDGFSVSAVRAGIKSSGKLDLGLIATDKPTMTAAVFTSNRVCAAPVKLSRAHLRTNRNQARAILVNSGNANCCTGKQGDKDAQACVKAVAKNLNCKPKEVLMASTGIIGEPLPMQSVLPGIAQAVKLLASKKPQDQRFADAIRTLDTHPKEAGATCRIGGKTVKIAGAAKGIGMCAPNLATVLIFLLTDAVINQRILQAILKEVVDDTFNRVTVDSDMSTNDSCFLMASGKAGNQAIGALNSKDAKAFRQALFEVCLKLAKMLAADGEGATKYLEVQVSGAKNQADADKVARAIAESPLVKTAVCGADPNWGRVLMAAGKCGAAVEAENCRLRFGKHLLFNKGKPAKFTPAEIARYMGKKEIIISLDLGLGKAKAEIYTCDLTHGYITINAEYHN